LAALARQDATEVRIYGKHAPRTLREEFAAANTLAATRDVVSEDMAMFSAPQIGSHRSAAKAPRHRHILADHIPCRGQSIRSRESSRKVPGMLTVDSDFGSHLVRARAARTD